MTSDSVAATTALIQLVALMLPAVLIAIRLAVGTEEDWVSNREKTDTETKETEDGVTIYIDIYENAVIKWGLFAASTFALAGVALLIHLWWELGHPVDLFTVGSGLMIVAFGAFGWVLWKMRELLRNELPTF